MLLFWRVDFIDTLKGGGVSPAFGWGIHLFDDARMEFPIRVRAYIALANIVESVNDFSENGLIYAQNCGMVCIETKGAMECEKPTAGAEGETVGVLKIIRRVFKVSEKETLNPSQKSSHETGQTSDGKWG